MMKIHVFHTGKVCVSPNLPFGGNCSTFKAAGLWLPMSKRLWLPVSSYLVEHPKGKILVDCGWHREMSPDGVFDKKAQIRSLGSRMLYHINQGMIEKGAAIDEQLAKMNVKPEDIDYVLLTHLDCDHANGLKLVSGAKHILVSREEMEFSKNGSLTNRVRYQSKWWDGVDMTLFDCAHKNTIIDKRIVDFGIPLFNNIHLCGSVLTETFFVCVVSQLLYGHLPTVEVMVQFILLLGVFAVGAPGVPGGTVLASLGIVISVLGFDDAGTALLITIFALQDSFGTACNVTGDAALTMIVDAYDRRSGNVNY